MTDIVERLRERGHEIWTSDKRDKDGKLLKEAAHEIEHWKGHAERLREECEFHLAEIERLRGYQGELIAAFRVNMMRHCKEYSDEEFDRIITALEGKS